MSFIHDNFLLSNDQAVRLYHDYARDEPILDFHNHLPPDEIANNRRFENGLPDLPQEAAADNRLHKRQCEASAASHPNNLAKKKRLKSHEKLAK